MNKQSALIFFLAIVFGGIFTALPGQSVTLLSDSVIEDITAADGTVSVWIEDERRGYIDDTFYYGDENGIPALPVPGYLGYVFPTPDFQSTGISTPSREYPDGYYNDFEYRFATEQEANTFQAYLEANGYANIRQRLIYSNASADHIFSDDGTASEVVQAIVITDSQVSPAVVRQYDGTIVAEPIVFSLSFPGTIGKTETVIEKETWPGEKNKEWVGPAHQYAKPGWPAKHYSATEAYVFTDYHYNKMVEYGAGISEGGPILAGGTGNVLVPADTVFLKNVLAPMNFYSPLATMAVCLVPPNDDLTGPYTGPGCCALGVVTAENINIHFGGTANDGAFGEVNDGHGIYIYAYDTPTLWDKIGIPPPP